MNLSYRGVSYTHEPPTVEQIESDLKGQYRGHQFRFGYPRHIPPSHPVVELTYRGVPYQTTATGEIQTVTPTRPESQPAARSLRDVLTFRHPNAHNQRRVMTQELAEVHHRNLYQLLEHRIQVARTKGDQTLVEQLEQERRQLV